MSREKKGEAIESFLGRLGTEVENPLRMKIWHLKRGGRGDISLRVCTKQTLYPSKKD